jgi:hypothetical protein
LSVHWCRRAPREDGYEPVEEEQRIESIGFQLPSETFCQEDSRVQSGRLVIGVASLSRLREYTIGEATPPTRIYAATLRKLTQKASSRSLIMAKFPGYHQDIVMEFSKRGKIYLTSCIKSHGRVINLIMTHEPVLAALHCITSLCGFASMTRVARRFNLKNRASPS